MPLNHDNRTKDPVNLGDLRRVTPVSRGFGCNRGVPIDRYYIEGFLSTHADDIRDHVLEFGDDVYTRRFGGDRVTQSDVLHAGPGNPRATIIADLSAADDLGTELFDCIVCTQVLMYIYPVGAAIQTLHRLLKPSGVLLTTFPGISQISRYDMDQWGEYWRFTTLSARRLFEEPFGPMNVAVQGHGNVLAAIAFLHGLAVDELRTEELDHADPEYELLIGVRSVKAHTAAVDRE
jgi:SAM-dependent methyltransferase